MRRSYLNIMRIAAVALCIHSQADAGVHLSLTGYDSKTHAGRQISSNSSLGGSIALDLLTYLRFGLSYSQRVESTYGQQVYKDSSGGVTLPDFENTVTISQYSLDLTVALYNGEVVTPYIFGGMAKKSYEYLFYNEYDNLGEPQTLAIKPKRWVWNAGFGVQVALSTRLSLKASYSLSEGSKVNKDGKDVTVMDTYLQYGASYRL